MVWWPHSVLGAKLWEVPGGLGSPSRLLCSPQGVALSLMVQGGSQGSSPHIVIPGSKKRRGKCTFLFLLRDIPKAATDTSICVLLTKT